LRVQPVWQLAQIAALLVVQLAPVAATPLAQVQEFGVFAFTQYVVI
jgi:hypothetical protein